MSNRSQCFRYLDGALLLDNESAVGDRGVPTGHRRDYVPSADPGSRLPHMLVRILSDSPREVPYQFLLWFIISFHSGKVLIKFISSLISLPVSYQEVVSTLDLVSMEKLEFLLIISPLEESYQLACAMFRVAEEFKANVKVCVLWPSDIVRGTTTQSKLALAPWQNLIDVMEVKMQSNPASWWSICKMTETGSILVRPDQHVSWRVKASVSGDPTLEMRRVFSAILGTRS